MSALFQMFFDDLKKIFVRRFRTDVSLRVLKDPDQADIIIVAGQIRLHVLKIPYMNRHIIRIHVAVSVDQTALLRKFYAGHLACLP